MESSTSTKSNSIKIISILICLTIFVMLLGVGCSAKKDGDIEVQATVSNIERGYDKFERKLQILKYLSGGKTMKISYRKLSIQDLDIFINMRISQLLEEGAKQTLDLQPNLLDYYNRHLKDGTFVSWLALDDDKIIGTSGMSFVEKPPYFSNPSGKIGLLSSMYTLENYRRMGIAKTLLDKVINEAKAYGCGAVQITASDMGVLLYTNYGFKKNGNFMQYTF